jgi:hypothetical protein
MEAGDTQNLFENRSKGFCFRLNVKLSFLWNPAVFLELSAPLFSTLCKIKRLGHRYCHPIVEKLLRLLSYRK